MISDEEKTRIIEVLGNHYTKKIIPVLNEKKIVNENNEPYSASAIRNFVCGKRENIDIELVILKFVKQKYIANAKAAEKRKNLIFNK